MGQDAKLFSEFDPVKKAAWKEKAISDLKGADFDKKLVWKTDEGIDVQPYYTSEDLESTDISIFQNESPERKWINFSEVKVKDQKQDNHLILNLLKFDVKGITLVIDKPDAVDFNLLLKDIDLTQVMIGFQLSIPSPELIKKYFDYLSEHNIDLNEINGYVQADVLEEWSVTGQKPDFEKLAEIIKTTVSAKNFKGLMLSSGSFVNAGSGIAQEMAFTLNKLTDTIEELERLGINSQSVLDEIGFHLAIGGDYFFEIAKIRAFRKIAKEILNCYSQSIPDIFILSSNSMWSKSLYDPNVNMLRNTTETMSAIIGGCDAILIKPHDSTYKTPEQFSKRIALNISNLLREESYFDKVVDPAAGSYYIESITAQLAEKSLQLFKQIESEGGYIKAFQAGDIQNQIRAIKNKKESEISTRKRVYVGTNKYPDFKEKISSKLNSDNTQLSSENQLLKPQRSVKTFEQLRQETQKHFEATQMLPKVYLACYGNLAMRKARAAFASEFFGTAGFEIMGEFFNDNIQKLAEESAKSEADVVVICSSDPEYESEGKTFAEGFKKVGKDKKLILAGYPAEIVEDLKKSGVDDFIHVKTNVIDFISKLQKELFAKLAN